MAASLTKHLVIPGQIIAVSSGGDDDGGGFLRGHGTYVETIPSSGDPNTNPSQSAQSSSAGNAMSDGGDDHHEAASVGQRRLVASVAGTVERVNRLVSVLPASASVYAGQVGDLVVGRIASVGTTRWKVGLQTSPSSSGNGSGGGGTCREAHLPLSGVDLPGGVQRIRTAEDARGMRRLYAEGDLLSAEVQQVTQSDGTLILHTRSLRYGKLENGLVVQVPPGLVRRMRQHMCTLDGIGVDVLIGCNGAIWVQRSLPKVGGGGGGTASAASTSTAMAVDEDGAAPLAETLQKIRQRHAATPVLPDERESIVRVRNSIVCLRSVHCYVTSDTIRKVYDASVKLGYKVGEMMKSEAVLALTESTRSATS